MSIEELKDLLKRKNVPLDLVAFLDGGTPLKEQLCLSFERGMWEVYYYERGNKINLHRFLNEDEACMYLIEMIKKVGYVVE
jgi:hypothetical protein